ncbi:MAG: hypothetical protein U0X20_25955 [Caldilineaceae bacterium]
MQLRVFSYGGGVQSTAALVLAARKEIDFGVFAFANVGDDSEHPKTLAYIREVARPYAEAKGIVILELRKTFHGFPESLLAHIRRCERSLPLPVRMSNGAPGRRSCTADFKIDVIAKWQRKNGASRQEPAVTGLGISTDEAHRARTDSGIAWQTLTYPLLDLGLDRAACVEVIKSAGLPVPPKSACWFCPFHRRAEWERMQREEPDLLRRAIDLERLLNERRRSLGRDPVYLHSSAKPLAQVMGLDEAIGAHVYGEETEMCDSGYCMI